MTMRERNLAPARRGVSDPRRRPMIGVALLFVLSLSCVKSSPAQDVTSAPQVTLTAREQAWLDQHPTIRVRIASFPPYIIMNADEPEGISIDYLKLIADRTGITFTFVRQTRYYPEAIDAMAAGQGPDLMPCIVESNDRGAALSDSYVISPYVIVTRLEEPFLTSFEDLEGRTIATTHGIAAELQAVEPGPKIEYEGVDLDFVALRMVSTGQADAYVGDLTLATHEILKHGFSNLKVAGPSPLPDRRFCFGMRPDWPELRSIVNKGLASITPGEASAIRSRYLAVRYEHGVTPTDVLLWVLGVGGAAALIVGLFFMWNRRLRQLVDARSAAAIESEAKFRRLVEQAPVSIQVIEPGGKIVEVNEAWKRLWAISNEAVPGVLDAYNILEDEEAASRGVMPLIRRAFAGETVVLPPLEYDTRRTLDGLGLPDVQSTKRWIQARMFPITNRDGAVLYVVDIEEDISERVRSESELERYQSRLRSLASELAVAEDQERGRLAADLHDHVGQMLALARVQLATAVRDEGNEVLSPRLAEVSETILQASQETRRLIADLSSPELRELGLAAAIAAWMRDHIEHRFGLSVELVDDAGASIVQSLDGDIRAILFRNVRELLTNVVKHADARNVTVRLHTNNGQLEITVRDDGVGLANDEPRRVASLDGGFGLFSIRERMADLDGTLTIESSPGLGFTAVMSVPLPPADGPARPD